MLSELDVLQYEKSGGFGSTVSALPAGISKISDITRIL
jgi:hypothetical protein